MSLKSLRVVPDSGQRHSELSRTAASFTQSCPGQRAVSLSDVWDSFKWLGQHITFIFNQYSFSLILYITVHGNYSLLITQEELKKLLLCQKNYALPLGKSNRMSDTVALPWLSLSAVPDGAQLAPSAVPDSDEWLKNANISANLQKLAKSFLSMNYL